MKKLITFNVGFVAFEKDKDEEYYSVGFSEDEFQFENHMFFSRSYSEEEKDEPEYSEVNDQVYGGYDICKNAILSDDSFCVNLVIDNEIWQVIMNIEKIELHKTMIDYLKFILKDKLEIK